MADESYEVVFHGKITKGRDQATVIANMAKLFRSGEDKIARLFSGGEFILKSNLDHLTAQRYQQTLGKAGALCEIRPRPAAGSVPAAATSSSADATPAATPPDAPGSATASVDTATTAPEAGGTGTGALQLDPPGVMILEQKEKPVREVDTSGLSLAPVGADVLEGETRPEPPPPPSTEGLSLAPLGSNILDDEQGA